MHGLFRRDSIYLVLWFLQLGGAAALTPLITRVMESGQFGGVAAGNAVMQVLFVLAGLGLQTAVQREFAAPDGHASARRLVTLTLVAAGAITSAAWLSAPWWGPVVGFDRGSHVLRLAILWAGVSAVTAATLALLRSQDRLLAFASVSLLQSVVAEATSLLLLVCVRPSAEMFLLGQLLAQVAATALALVLVRPLALRRADRALVWGTLRYAFPLVPAVLGQYVLGASDRLLIQAELGTAAVGRYQIAYNIGSIPMLLLSVLSSVWLPRFFEIEDEQHRSAATTASRDALYDLLAPVLVGLSAGAPVLLRVWAPGAYAPADLLGITTIVIVTVLPFTAALTAQRNLLLAGQTSTIALITLLAAAANVALNLVLLPHFGLLGSAWATLAAYALLDALAMLRGRPESGVPRPVRNRLVLSVTVVAAATAVPSHGIWLAVRLLVAIGCLCWFGWVLRGVSTASKQEGFPFVPREGTRTTRPGGRRA